jgi:hypothetical protein
MRTRSRSGPTLTTRTVAVRLAEGASGRQLTPDEQARLEREQRVLEIWDSIEPELRRDWLTQAILVYEGSDAEQYRPGRILRQFKEQVDRMVRVLDQIDQSGGRITEAIRLEIDDLGERAVSMVSQAQTFED